MQCSLIREFILYEVELSRYTETTQNIYNVKGEEAVDHTVQYPEV